MSSWAQEHEQMGLEKGLELGLELGLKKGLKTGEQEGQARTLVRMLERRFGALSSKLRARIRSADTTTLDIWADRFAEGGDLEAMLRGGAAAPRCCRSPPAPSIPPSGSRPDRQG